MNYLCFYRKKLPGNSLMVCQLRSLNVSASNPWTERKRRKVVVLAESRFAWVDSVAEICGKAHTQPRFSGTLATITLCSICTAWTRSPTTMFIIIKIIIFLLSSFFHLLLDFTTTKKKHLRLLYYRRPHYTSSSKNLFNATPPYKLFNAIDC